MPKPKGKDREEVNPGERISKTEDTLIRAWLQDEYGIKVRQWYFWKLTMEQAYQQLLRERSTMPDGLSAEALAQAARRQ